MSHNDVFIISFFEKEIQKNVLEIVMNFDFDASDFDIKNDSMFDYMRHLFHHKRSIYQKHRCIIIETEIMF